MHDPNESATCRWNKSQTEHENAQLYKHQALEPAHSQHLLRHIASIQTSNVTKKFINFASARTNIFVLKKTCLTHVLNMHANTYHKQLQK